MKKNHLMAVHISFAIFLMPALLMFLVTGALYTWGIKGGYYSTNYEINLEKPLEKNKYYISDLVKKNLEQKNIDFPTGNYKIKSAGTSYYFEWTGSNIDINFSPTKNPLVANLKVKDTSMYRTLVQLHKGKGGVIFKVYATLLAISLVFMLITGFLMALKLPNYRKTVFLTSSFSIALFFIAVFLS